MFKPLVNPLQGLKIIEDKSLTIPDGTITVTRSWKERLFTRPWKPWVATKEIFNIIPNPELFYIKDRGIVLAHPVTAKRLYDELVNELEK
ncbi:MAG TPA: hypothetical protein ENI23_03020 [bacterium]|nr:hypothetical protein [bacterium]